jgi:hypothetical protein
MQTPLTPMLLISFASGQLSGRTSFACTFDPDHRRRMLQMPVPEDEGASIRFINSAGFLSHLDHDTGESSWPIPVLYTVQQLAHYGQRHKILFDMAEAGDIAVVWNEDEQRYTRASIVVSVLSVCGGGRHEVVHCSTLGAHRRGAIARPECFRPGAGDRFLRWMNLDRRASYGGFSRAA